MSMMTSSLTPWLLVFLGALSRVKMGKQLDHFDYPMFAILSVLLWNRKM
jgi:hypothetical protein